MSEISLEELEKLLALAETDASEEEIVFQEMDEVERFCYDEDIVAGDKRVPAYYVYDKYLMYKKVQGEYKYKMRLPRPIFFRRMKQMYDQKRTKEGMFYLLNERSFDFSQEAFWEIRRRYRDEKERNRRKKVRNRKITKMVNLNKQGNVSDGEKEADQEKQS